MKDEIEVREKLQKAGAISKAYHSEVSGVVSSLRSEYYLDLVEVFNSGGAENLIARATSRLVALDDIEKRFLNESNKVTKYNNNLKELADARLRELERANANRYED